MSEFDPRRIASEWHSGQGSALYAYASTDRIPTEDFKDRLVQEIEHSMAGADDRGLDELEYLLMHVEDQHPDRYPGSEMHEAWGTVDKDGNETEFSDDDADIRDLYVDDDVSNARTMNISHEDRVRGIGASVWEGDGAACNECGGMKVEGVCECSMTESEELDEVELGWLRAAADKVKGLAMTDVGGPEGFLSPSDKAQRNGTPSSGKESSEFAAWKAKRRSNESLLRSAVLSILDEMKLSVAGRQHFNFGGGEEVNPDDVAHFLLSKNDVPKPEESGVKAKAKAKPRLKRKSKKTA